MTEEKIVETVEEEKVETPEAQAPVAEPAQEAAPANPLLREHTFTIPVATVNENTEKELRRIRKTAKIHGFRPGKAPMQIISATYYVSAHADVTEKLIDEKVKEFFETSSDVNFASYPFVSDVKLSEDQNEYICTTKYEVFPDVKVPDCSKLELTRISTEITEEDRKRMLDRMLHLFATYKDVERPAQAKDQIKASVKAVFPDDETLNMENEDASFILSGGDLIPQINDEVLGMSAGAEKTFSFTYPELSESFKNERLAGKNVEYTVKVKNVQEAVLPELTPEFVKNLGVESGDVDAFIKTSEKNFEMLVNTRVKSTNKEAVMNALIGLIDFPVPVTAEEQQRLELVSELIERTQGKKPTEEELRKAPAGIFAEEARNRVGLSLMLKAITEQQQFKAEESEVKALAEEIAQSYQSPEEVVNWYLTDRERRNELNLVCIESKVVDWVFSQAKVTEKQMTCSELLQLPE